MYGQRIVRFSILLALCFTVACSGLDEPPLAEPADGSRMLQLSDFLEETAAADHATYLATQGTLSAASFNAMKRHVLSLYAGTTAMHSFLDIDDHPVDCLPVEQQPSLASPLLRGHKVQSQAPPPPPSLLRAHATPSSRADQGSSNRLRPGDRDELGNERYCQPGTIPMRRVDLQVLARFDSLEGFLRKGPLPGLQTDPGGQRVLAATHRYANSFQAIDAVGGSSVLNLWSPTVAQNQMSLSQQGYAGGSGSDRQTVEGGWQVYPQKFNTNNAVLFIFWTSQGYTNGCYNLDCAGFVQLSHSWVLGRGFDRYSVTGGEQRSFTMAWQRHASSGDWWLYLSADDSTTAVGYYPKALFGKGQLATHATQVHFIGETTGEPVSLQMGSGEFAANGWQHAAYQRNVEVYPAAGGSGDANLTPDQTDVRCYTIDLTNGPGSDWGTHFYFGGPRCPPS